jgi:folate-binding protein YgfZ
MSNPLENVHRQSEAEFQPYGELEIVTTFGEPPAEYAALHKSAGLIDFPQRGFIELSGKDRLSFLNNIITNQTWDKQTKSPLEPGKGVYAFILNAKSGRIITDVQVINRPDRTLLEMDRRLVEPVRQLLDRYLFAEQVKLIDRSDELHEIALLGPQAANLLGECGAVVSGMGLNDSMSAGVFDVDLIIRRDDPTGSPGFFLIIPTADVRKIWMELLSRFAHAEPGQKRALRPIGWAAFNSARIEAGRPLFGIDFDQTILPHETGPLLDRAVSFTKGCYPGQEIVARMHARKQVARKIVGLRMQDDALSIAGTKISDPAGNEIGAVTSSTLSPVLSRAAIALAILKRPHFDVGTTVQVPAEGAIRNATVVALPFAR